MKNVYFMKLLCSSIPTSWEFKIYICWKLYLYTGKGFYLVFELVFIEAKGLYFNQEIRGDDSDRNNKRKN